MDPQSISDNSFINILVSLRIAGSRLAAALMLFGMGLALAGLSLQLASMGLEHSGKTNGGLNQWIIRVKMTPGGGWMWGGMDDRGGCKGR